MALMIPDTVLAQQAHRAPTPFGVPAYLAGLALGSFLGVSMNVIDRTHRGLTRPRYVVERH